MEYIFTRNYRRIARNFNVSENAKFRNNNIIETFNEMKYFTRWTSISPHFFQSSSILSVDLRNVTTIGLLCFLGCPSLVSVKNTENLTTIGADAFTGSVVVNMGNLRSVTSVSNNAFEKLPLTDYIFDLVNLTSIPILMFAGNNLTKRTVYLPKVNTFSASSDPLVETNKPAITFGADIQSFQKSESLTGYNILYLGDVTTLQCFAFKGVSENIVINNTTPPTCSTCTISSLWCYFYSILNVTGTPFLKVPEGNSTSPRDHQSITIYVPSSAYNTYLSTPVLCDLPSGTILKLEESTIYINRLATEEEWHLLSNKEVLIEEYM